MLDVEQYFGSSWRQKVLQVNKSPGGMEVDFGWPFLCFSVFCTNYWVKKQTVLLGFRHVSGTRTRPGTYL